MPEPDLHTLKDRTIPHTSRSLFRGVLDKLLSRSKTELCLYSPRSLIRGVFDFYLPLFEDAITRRSAKRSQAEKPPLERRGAYLRPRKLDGILSKHGLGARRVALLAPRATFSVYCLPLDYVSAINKLF